MPISGMRMERIRPAGGEQVVEQTCRMRRKYGVTGYGVDPVRFPY